MKFQSIENIAEKIKHPKFSQADFLASMMDKEYLINQLVRAKFYEEIFDSKVTGVTKTLADVVPNSTLQLKVGDLVTFTNEYGVSFVNNKILGFDLEPMYNRVVYLDQDSYWFAVEINSLTLQDGYVGIDEQDLAIVEEQYKNSHVPLDVQAVRMQRAEKTA